MPSEVYHFNHDLHPTADAVSMPPAAVHSILNHGSVELLNEIADSIPAEAITSFLNLFSQHEEVDFGDVYLKLRKLNTAFSDKNQITTVQDYLYRFTTEQYHSEVAKNREGIQNSVRYLIMRDMGESFIHGYNRGKTDPDAPVVPASFWCKIYKTHFTHANIKHCQVPENERLAHLIFSSIPEEDMLVLLKEQIVPANPDVYDLMMHHAAHYSGMPLNWLQEMFPNFYNMFHGR